MSDLVKRLQDANFRGVSPPQDWTTRAIEEIQSLNTSLQHARGVVEAYTKAFNHLFSPRGPKNENNDDRFCKECGLYITDQIHTRLTPTPTPGEQEP